MRILLVEDSQRLRRTLEKSLRRSGYAVDSAGDGPEGLFLAGSNDYDAMVLDVMLPGLDGLSLLRRLRRAGHATHVLLLTARDAVEDRVRGLEAGADDYLVKPFALEELLARVRALCRRGYGRKDPLIAVGDLVVDSAAKVARRGGVAIDLSPREYRLLELLALRRGEVVGRGEIEGHIYDDLCEPMSNVVDSAICALRRKLSALGDAPLIHTRRGLGYVLEEAGP